MDAHRFPADNRFLPADSRPVVEPRRHVEGGLANRPDPDILSEAPAPQPDVADVPSRAGSGALQTTVEVPGGATPELPQPTAAAANSDLPPPQDPPPTVSAEVPEPNDPSARPEIARNRWFGNDTGPPPTKWEAHPAHRRETVVGKHGRIEHLHFEQHTVSVNLDHPRRDLATQAVEELSDGVPPTWTEIPTRHRQYHHNAPQGEGAEPTLFAKERQNLTPKYVQERLAGLDAAFQWVADEMPPETAGLIGQESRRAMAEASLRVQTTAQYELELAPKIRKVADSPEAQAIAQAHNYAGISFVEPLAVVRDVETQQEVVAYPWQSGQAVFDNQTGQFQVSDQEQTVLDSVASRMDELFDRHGIVAGDLLAKQFRIQTNPDGSRTLQLTDAELYYEKPEGYTDD
jgi:hypothetical protein